MKKQLAFLFLSAIIASGCADKTKPYVLLPSSYDKEGNFIGVEQNYFVINIEGCQYILIGSGQDRALTHKGDCYNPIHYYNVERQERSSVDGSTNLLSNLDRIQEMLLKTKEEMTNNLRRMP